MPEDSLVEREGFVLAEEHRGEVDLESAGNRWAFLALGIATMASCAVMVVGAGGTLTWIGAAAVAVLIVLGAVVASRDIERQNRIIEELEEPGEGR